MSLNPNTCSQLTNWGFPKTLRKRHYLGEGSTLILIKFILTKNLGLIFSAVLVDRLAYLSEIESIGLILRCQQDCFRKGQKKWGNTKLFIWLLSSSIVCGTLGAGVGGGAAVLAGSVDSSVQKLSTKSIAAEEKKILPCLANKRWPDSKVLASSRGKSLMPDEDSCNESLESLSIVSHLVSRSQLTPDRSPDEADAILGNIWFSIPKTAENWPSSISIDQISQAQPQQSNPSQSVEEESESPDAEVDPDLGRLRLRERKVPPRQSQPILHVIPRISYFYTNNVFSGVDPVEDSLYFPSLTLWSTPKLGPSTYLTASVDGSLIRYLSESEYDYNLLRFRTGIYQRFNSRMGGEIGWNNQQYFRGSTGDRFLDEHFIYLSLSRRDWLTQKLALDSFYDVRLSFANPDNRSRLSNYLSVSLSYYFQPNLQVGMDYQFSFSDFTKSDREDYYHRLLSHLSYGVSKDSQINLQGGVTIGGSSEANIDFDSLFLSVTYSLDLQVF